MNKEAIAAALGGCFTGFEEAELGGLPFYRGKVRDVVRKGDKLLIVASDRISAFDRVLSTIPFKGEVLARIARFWFEATADIIPNHLIRPGEEGYADASFSPRSTWAKACEVLPVEVIVRGYVTGSAWRDYEAGRPVSGIRLPAGLRQNQRLAEPILTPTTKEAEGHDRPISCAEIVARGIVPAAVWKQVEAASLALFRRGTEIAAGNGLILVDTKYEFGMRDGKLHLVDEMHTPDSSRYWYADSYADLFAGGEKQRELDKEYFRRWLMERGYMGDGQPPAIPDELRVEVASRYMTAYETITGKKFEPMGADMKSEKEKLLSFLRK